MHPTPKAGGAVQPSPEEIRAYLARLLDRAEFRASARRRQMLAYVVEQTLAGRAGQLKAYDIALTVLGRDDGFDPQNDPIVRIEFGRLRRDLEQYYATDGRDDPIRLTIPKGHYIPAFELRQEERTALPAAATMQAPPVPGRPRLDRQHRIVTLACVVLAVAAFAAWARWSPDRPQQIAGPVVIVETLQALSGGEDGRLLASGLTNGLIDALMRFDALQVFAAAPDGGRAPLPASLAGAPAFLVTGGVERWPQRLRVTVRLTGRETGQVFWSRSYDQALTTADLAAIEDELVGGIAGRLAQVYGVINDATVHALAASPPTTLFAYDCVQRAFAYRRTFEEALYPPVRACLEEAVRRDPGYAGAWAMLAFAHLDAARFGLVEPQAAAGELDAGLAAAQRAVVLAPESVRSLQSLAALRYAHGDFAGAEEAQRQAIALNPHDPESLAQLGWRLMARGRWDEGGELMQEAIAHSLAAPTWYYENLTYARYLAGDLTQARAAATLASPNCCGFGHIVLALTEAALGETEAAQRELAAAIRDAPLLERDPVAFWARFQAAPEVIERLNAGLAKAGLKIPPPPEAAARAAPS